MFSAGGRCSATSAAVREIEHVLFTLVLASAGISTLCCERYRGFSMRVWWLIDSTGISVGQRVCSLVHEIIFKGFRKPDAWAS